MDSVYCVKWSDKTCKVNGMLVWFRHSVHRTKTGAMLEARRMRKLSQGGTMRYTVDKHALLK